MERGVNARVYGRYSVTAVECCILFAPEPVLCKPLFWLMANVAFGALPPQRNVMVALEITSLKLAGSILPKLRVLVAVLNRQLFFDNTTAVTKMVLFPAARETAAVAATTAAMMNRYAIIFTVLPFPLQKSDIDPCRHSETVNK